MRRLLTSINIFNCITNEDKDLILKELHEEDDFRNEFGKDMYLRSCGTKNGLQLDKLTNVCYIIWESY